MTFDLGSVVATIARAVPAQLPQVTVPPLPDFRTVAPLAATVSADPQRVLRAAQSLLDDRTTLTDTLHQATPLIHACLLYTSPSPRDRTRSRMPSSA